MQREVIKWIQSLDLSFPVHNPRRDLMNGFVVAEILSRYDKNVSMHSFDTGSSLVKRLDNWQQIAKILQRMKCTTINDDLMTLVAQGRDGAARRILEEMYMLLTKRKLHAAPSDNGAVGSSAPLGTVDVAAKLSAAAELPAFMRPTAAKILRDENDATGERFAKLTGKMDQLKLRSRNEAALESHEVALQAQKYQEPERFRPRPRPPPQSAGQSGRGAGGTVGPGGAGGTAATSRARQKLQAARQLAVRGVDENILAAFQQRQEHEREEQFKAQFDVNEDLATALSRVCVRPLAQTGLVEALDEYAASAGGSGGSDDGYGGDSGSSQPRHHDASSMSATAAAAATGDYFCKFVDHRAVMPSDAKSLVWESLHSVAANIAKHLHHRPEELYHLAFSLSFALRSREDATTLVLPGSSGDAAHGEDDDHPVEFGGHDAGCAFSLLAAVGQQWQKMDLDAPTQAAAHILVPAWAEAIAAAPPAALRRVAAVFRAFCNPRDVESLKLVITNVASSCGRANPAVTAAFAANFLVGVDAKLCLGLDEVVEYYASQQLVSARVTDRASALRLLKMLAQHAPLRLEPLLPAARQVVLGDPEWEVRLIGLSFACALQKANNELAHAAAAAKGHHGGGGRASAAPSISSPRAESDVAPSPRSPSTSAAAGGGAADGRALLSAEDAAELVEQAFAGMSVYSSLAQRAALCVVAPHLNYDDHPALCDAFVHRLVDLGHTAFTETLRDDGSAVRGLPGRVFSVHVAGGIVSFWNAVAVACALVNARTSLSTYEFLVILDALVSRAEISGADRGVWVAVAEQSKTDIVDAVLNPANTRGVTEGQLATCTRLATATALRFYTELSGEDDTDLRMAQQQEDEEDAMESYERKLQERALDWVQSAL